MRDCFFFSLLVTVIVKVPCPPPFSSLFKTGIPLIKRLDKMAFRGQKRKAGYKVSCSVQEGLRADLENTVRSKIKSMSWPNVVRTEERNKKNLAKLCYLRVLKIF